MNESLINDKLHLSKLYFKSKDYEKALHVYSEIIDVITGYSPGDIKTIRRTYNLPPPVVGTSIHPKLTSILDQRAACYEKLNLVDYCLKDSYKIIDVNPCDVKAYLRIGKNYTRLHNPNKALKVYEKAIKLIRKLRTKHPNLKVNELQWKLLKDNYTKILNSQRQLIHANTTDPLDYLNFDILELIFSHLLTRNILLCQLVCKKWYYNLTSLNCLYSNVALKPKVSCAEFKQGKILFKYKKFNTFVINITNELELWKILSTITLHHFCIKKFIILNNFFSFNGFITKLDKHGFSFNFKSIEYLKFMSDSTIDHVTQIFPNLSHLEVLFLDHLSSSLPIINKQAFNKITNHDRPSNLSTLILVNDPPKSMHSPPLLNQSFRNLSTLVISCFNFNNIQPLLGKFLQKMPKLLTLVLENNQSLSLKHFLNNLINYPVDFKLKKLTFREHCLDNPLSLREFHASDFSCLDDLSHLDIYSSSLSNTGLLKFLSYININNTLLTLVLGYSNYIYFKNDLFNNIHKINISDILKLVPNLIHLSLVNLNLDGSSLKFFGHDIKNGSQLLLKTLDISFNAINGMGLLSLFQSPKLDLDKLIIDGISINPDTLRLIEKRFNVEIQNDFLKTKWCQYGVNSYIPEV